jgi:hypothetical protein
MPWLELAVADLPQTSPGAQFDASISKVRIKLELFPWVEEGQIDQSDFHFQQYTCRQLCLG